MTNEVNVLRLELGRLSYYLNQRAQVFNEQRRNKAAKCYYEVYKKLIPLLDQNNANLNNFN